MSAISGTALRAGYLRNYRLPGQRQGVGDYVRAPTAPGFAYRASVAGETGLKEPAWPRVLAGSVVDGSVTWIADAVANGGVDAISVVTWSQINPPDATLVIGSQTNAVEEATAKLSAGTSGSTYRVRCVVDTVQANRYTVEFDLEVQ